MFYVFFLIKSDSILVFIEIRLKQLAPKMQAESREGEKNDY